MLAILITFISAISISVIAAGYSIIGLATIFAGAYIPIIAMGSALEVGKLVAASWLYNNWQNKLVPKTIKAYLTTAVVVLIFITSMGIFGFLSKAHLDSVQPQANFTIQTELIDKQIANEEKIITRAEDTLNQLDAALDKYIDMEYVTRGLKEREKQKDEREALQLAINNAVAKISELQIQKSTISLEKEKIEAEVGPLKYIAELIYGDDAKDHFDEAVRYAIMVLIFVFDPLAVLLLIAANISLRSYKETRKVEKADKTKEIEKKLNNERQKNTRLRQKEREFKKQERDYKAFIQKLGAKELSDLDPDEIKIKMDQIVDWNDMSTSKKKPGKYVEIGAGEQVTRNRKSKYSQTSL